MGACYKQRLEGSGAMAGELGIAGFVSGFLGVGLRQQCEPWSCVKLKSVSLVDRQDGIRWQRHVWGRSERLVDTLEYRRERRWMEKVLSEWYQDHRR